MKKIYVLWSLALMTIMANVFFACKSDDTLEDFYRQHGFKLNPTQNPDFVIYSNGNVLSTTLGTRSEFGTRTETAQAIDYGTVTNNEPYKSQYVFPSDPSGEYSTIREYIAGHGNEGQESCDFTNFYIQQLGSDGTGWNGTNGLWLCAQQMSNVSINGTALNNSSAYNFPGYLCLNVNATNVKYQVYGAEVAGEYKFFTINGCKYLGFNYTRPDAGYTGNGLYNDWIFKLTPAVASSQDGGTPVVVNSNYYKVQDWENTTKEHMPAEYAQYVDKAPAKTDRGESVSQDEYDYVMAYLAEHPNEGGLTCNLTTYFIQNVGSSYYEYKYEDFPTLKDHNGATYNLIGGNQMDFVAFSKHRNDYNAVNGPRALLINVPVEDPTYHDSWGDVDNTRHNAYRFYTIEYNGEKNLYLCYDYEMTKNSEEYLPGDKVFNDWVIKLIPAEGGDPEEQISDIIDPNIEPATPVTDEVEVNLSVNDEKEEGDYIATKLSIHIRALTDVEVFIPVEQLYYCDKDDMAIVLNHQLDPNYQYSNPGQSTIENGYSYTYTVAGEYTKDGETLTANETILITVKYEAEGIRVTTQGVTQAALDFLQDHFFDGITIEVWNYFNSEIPTGNPNEFLPVTRTDLKPKLDASTVTFTTSANVQHYVNAFAMLYDYQKADLHVYMKEDGKPYLMSVTYDGDGHIINQVETNTPLEQKYWIADADGNFVKFVGVKNAWDCTVTPPDAYSVSATHNGVDPADFNVIYTK